PAAHLGAHHAEVLDDQLRAHVEARHVVAPAHLSELVALAAKQEEAAEVAAVWLEEDRVPALDLALLLQPAPQLGCLLEHLPRLLLAAANWPAESDEETEVSHVHLLG